MSEEDQNLAEEGAEAVKDYTEDLESALSRPGENRIQRWFLIEGRRPVVTVALLGVVFAILLAGSLLRPDQLRTLLTETNTVKTLFNTLLSGVILLVSIVVSINSVVLSQEIGDIEAQEERTSASLEFRRRIEESIESDVTPARPAEFVRVVLYTILHKTNELQEVAADTADDEFQQHVEDLGKKISDDVNRARGILGDAQYRTFRVLLAGLNYDYAGQLHTVRYLKRTYGDDLTDEEVEAMDDIIDSLVFFTTGREYFKSLYYKREFRPALEPVAVRLATGDRLHLLCVARRRREPVSGHVGHGNSSVAPLRQSRVLRGARALPRPHVLRPPGVDGLARTLAAGHSSSGRATTSTPSTSRTTTTR